jgi:hypothetical protein
MESNGKVEENRDRWKARKRVRRNGIRKNMERRKEGQKERYVDGQQETEKRRKEEEE